MVSAISSKPLSRRGDTLTLTYDRLNATDFTTREAVKLDMRLTLDITLEGDEVRFASKIKNGQPHTIVRELHYPLVGGMPLPEDHKLLLTHTGGQLYDDPKGMIFATATLRPTRPRRRSSARWTPNTPCAPSRAARAAASAGTWPTRAAT